jgi:phosphohistidine phosphatase
LTSGRALTLRGHTQARSAGAWIAGQSLDPDHAITSPARRAVETWEDAATHLPQSPVPVIDDRIYDDNTAPALLAVIREVADEVNTLAVIGHNPGIAALAAMLDDGNGDPTSRATLAEGYRPAGTAVFAVQRPWAQLL